MARAETGNLLQAILSNQLEFNIFRLGLRGYQNITRYNIRILSDRFYIAKRSL